MNKPTVYIQSYCFLGFAEIYRSLYSKREKRHIINHTGEDRREEREGERREEGRGEMGRRGWKKRRGRAKEESVRSVFLCTKRNLVI